ncbi:hypothetical protein ACFX15_033738 [Malus domestica]
MMRPAWEMPKEQEGQHGNHQLLEMGPSRLRFASDQPSLVSGSDEEHECWVLLRSGRGMGLRDELIFLTSILRWVIIGQCCSPNMSKIS